MKNVLCFGDSNTYGYDPAGMRDGTAVRYAQDVRWCGVVQRDLGEGWHVIEEGLNGRTTVRDDMCHLDTNLNGIRALPMLLEAHKPLDAIVIMLGTNDCKTVFGVTASDIARGAMALIRAVRAFAWTDAAPCPRILLMASCADNRYRPARQSRRHSKSRSQTAQPHARSTHQNVPRLLRNARQNRSYIRRRSAA